MRHRVRNIFQRLFADEFECGGYFRTYAVVDAAGDVDPARYRQRFESRRDIDPVTVNRAVAFLEDVAEIDPDAKFHRVVGCTRGIALREACLDFDRGGDRAADAGEHGEDRVSGHIDDPAAVLRYRIAEHRAVLVERCDGAPLVDAHEA